MSASSADEWYYTSNGERLGPVSKEQLRELAVTGGLNPRLDLCWVQGMAEWSPAGEIDGLFQKTQSAGEDGEVPGNSQSSHSHGASKLSEQELKLELLNANWPGATRRVFLFALWVLPWVILGALTLFSKFFLNQGDPNDGDALVIASGVAGLLYLVVVIAVAVQRFHNLGMSGWWILGNMVPVLNLWVGYRAVCCPAGYEFHRKLDGVGIFLAIFYWGQLALGLIAIVLLILALLGMGGGMFADMEPMLEAWIEKAAEMREGNETPKE